jgi:cell division protein FtsW
LICILIAPANLSTALLVGGTSILLMFIGRVSSKHLLITIGLAMIPAILLISLAISTYDKEKHTAKKLPEAIALKRLSTWVSRIQTFLYSKKDENNEKSFQMNQAKIAIANGGWLGRGPGNSVQRNFLPHCYSDFIYAIIIEEYGVIGAAFIILMYLMFLFRSIRIYQKCPFAFGAFLSLALSFTLVIQAIANMGVNVSLFPNTGVTLPLLSMGGSSFFFTCISIGIILSVARNVEKSEGPQVAMSPDQLASEEVEESKDKEV